MTEKRLEQLKILHQNNVRTLDEWQSRLSIKSNDQFKVVDVFIVENEGKLFKAECNKCGYQFIKNVHYLRKSALHKKTTPCPICKQKQKELDKQQAQLNKEIKEVEHYYVSTFLNVRKPVELNHFKTKNCENCGLEIIATSRNTKYCSLCKTIKAKNKTNTRLQRMISRPHDNNIELKTLFKRDNGICYLCGNKCSFDDYHWTNGFKVVQNHYPTVDHVLAIANGGTHTWDNVKLACFSCNSKKGKKNL